MSFDDILLSKLILFNSNYLAICAVLGAKHKIKIAEDGDLSKIKYLT